MTDTPELDRAIVEAENAHSAFLGGPKVGVQVDDGRRTYARALIAELLRGMEPEGEGCHGLVQFYHHQNGFNSALAEIRRRAGLEGEG